jgi:hypothetical protein
MATSAVLMKHCGLYPEKNGFNLPPSSGLRMYNYPSKFLLICILPGLTKHIPLLISFLVIPLNNTPTLSPASP